MSIVTPTTDFVPGHSSTEILPWQRSLASVVRDAGELCQLLELPAEVAVRAERAAAGFPLRVPREFVSRMRPGDPHDPLLRQVLPLDDELRPAEGFAADPVGDAQAVEAPGLLHKYTGRVLLVTTGSCAVHCRYCFRRHYPYSEIPRGLAAWEPALEAIAKDDSIREVILSGGDPLTLVDEQLAALVTRLEAIPHVTRLRVHTRLPIVIPSRVDDSMLAWLSGTRLTPVMVVHANHAQELNDAVAAALARLSAAGVLLLNQAVLLRGVNDTVSALADLSERLIDLRVMPYYLHQLDRVAGAAHFEVPEETGRRLIRELQDLLPGYAVPKYVREVAGAASKRPIAEQGDR